nr:DUF3068 domain-containing protein [Gordonia araii]
MVFLAALLATVALASPMILAPQLSRISLDTNLVATGASTQPVETFDRCSLDRPTAAMLPPRRLVRSQRVVAVRPADRRVATLQAGTIIRRDEPSSTGCTDPTLVASLDRVTVDRVTGAPHGDSGVQTDSTRPAAVLTGRDGITYLFAPGTASRGHRFFDPVTRRSVPLKPIGRDTVNGRPVIRLRADIPDTNLAALPDADPRDRLTKPGVWFGWPGGEITADAHQHGSYTLWVDEQSGLIVDAEIAVRRDYRAGERRLTELDAVFRYDAKTRKSLAAAARTQARPAWLAGRIVPLVAVFGAVAAIAVAVWVGRRSSPAP